jgi:hypothetical protein
MVRRLLGTLLLVLLLLALLYTRSVWAEGSAPQTGQVTVNVSPLALLLEEEVTIQVGEYTCPLVQGIEPASICHNLPAGEYEVTAQAKGFVVEPFHYQIHVPPNNDLSFKLYSYQHQAFMPNVAP